MSSKKLPNSQSNTRTDSGMPDADEVLRMYQQRLRDADNRRSAALHKKADKRLGDAKAALARLRAAGAAYEERLEDDRG